MMAGTHFSGPLFVNGVQVSGTLPGLNIADYGAAADGVTDDSTALQNALDALTSGGTLYLNPGVYLISSTVTVPRSVNIIGSGRTDSNTYCTTLKNGVSSGDMLDLGGVVDVRITDLLMDGDALSFDLMGGTDVERCTFERVSFTNVDAAAINFVDPQDLYFRDCRFLTPNTPSTGNGTTVFTGTSRAVNNIVMQACTFENHKRTCIYITSTARANKCTFDRVKFEDGGVSTTYPIISATNAGSIYINNCVGSVQDHSTTPRGSFAYFDSVIDSSINDTLIGTGGAGTTRPAVLDADDTSGTCRNITIDNVTMNRLSAAGSDLAIELSGTQATANNIVVLCGKSWVSGSGYAIEIEPTLSSTRW